MTQDNRELEYGAVQEVGGVQHYPGQEIHHAKHQERKPRLSLAVGILEELGQLWWVT